MYKIMRSTAVDNDTCH